MKTKLFALLTALSLVSACAFAEIDLTPYELPSEYGSSVQGHLACADACAH